MVEILRGLMRNATILILDEPTASLTPGETERLFRQIRALQDLGVGIVFISHKLPEIRQLASHVSVMRDGAVVLSGETAQFDDNALIAAMTPVSREKGLSDAQNCGWRCRKPSHPAAGFSGIARGRSYRGGVYRSRLRSTLARSSVWPGWSDPGAPNLPRRSTACVRCVADGSGWRIRRSLTRAWAPGWTKARFICRRQAGVRPVPDAPIRWNTVALNEPSLWQQRKRESAVVERYHRALGIKLNHADQTVRTLSGGISRKCCWPAVWKPTRYC